MKRLLKILAIVFGLVMAIIFALNYFMTEEMPTGVSGPEADALAKNMMDACRIDAWNQTRYVHWTFAGANTYIWDRTRSRVLLSNSDGKFLIDSNSGQGLRKGDGSTQVISERESAAAWANFCNDSFWLIAPLKVMDPGTQRELVRTEDGEALLVHHEAGGVTPGDSYLWYIANDGLPYAMRMWTSSPPLNGIRATWTDWQELHTGALIATTHMISKANVAITNLRSGSELSEIGIETDPFDE